MREALKWASLSVIDSAATGEDDIANRARRESLLSNELTYAT
jgi:hypothetical protein